MPTFAILGGTGKVGRRLARSLTDAGHQARPVSRHAAVLAGGGYDGVTLDLPGPAAISFPEAAAILAAASGTPVRFADESDDDHVAGLRAAGTPEGYIRWRMAMLGGIRRGDDAYLSDRVPRVLGRPATSFADWARRAAPLAPWAPAARPPEQAATELSR
jgi:uncharacterized protein YbjT (DUF2867 family)